MITENEIKYIKDFYSRYILLNPQDPIIDYYMKLLIKEVERCKGEKDG